MPHTHSKKSSLKELSFHKVAGLHQGFLKYYFLKGIFEINI